MANETANVGVEGDRNRPRVQAVRSETDDVRLSEAAKRAIRGYMLGLLAIAGPIVAIISGAAGYMFNDFAKAQATAVATTNALKDIQAPLLAGQVAVAQALRDAEALQEKVGEIDRDVGLKLNAVNERSNDAIQQMEDKLETSAQALATAAANARMNVRDAETELRDLQERIELIPNVPALTESIERAAQGIVIDPGFQGIVAQKALAEFTGMVAAFATQCPEEAGWKPYDDAEGRFILGVGQGPLENKVTIEKTGGAEKHPLKLDEMPPHNHNIKGNLEVADEGVIAQPSHRFFIENRGDGSDMRAHPRDAMQGEGKPHNNMPPYIALYFCKKEG